MSDVNELALAISRLTGLRIENDSLRSKLTAYVSDLIANDFPSLVNLLYRIDVSEEKLKKALANNSEQNSAVIIADLIIERQKAKLDHFRNSEEMGREDGEEKW